MTLLEQSSSMKIMVSEFDPVKYCTLSQKFLGTEIPSFPGGHLNVKKGYQARPKFHIKRAFFSQSSTGGQLDIPTSHFSARFFIPKGRLSNLYLVL